MADHLVHRGEEVLRDVLVFPGTLQLLGRIGKLLGHSVSQSGAKGTGRPGKDKTLAAILVVDFGFVRQVLADGIHLKIGRLNKRFHGIRERRMRLLELVLALPRCVLLEVTGVGGETLHQFVHPLINNCHVGLRGALDAARVFVNFNESIGEVNLRVVPHPIDIELSPVGR